MNHLSDPAKKGQLLKACEELVSHAKSVLRQHVDDCDEINKAIKHVELAVHYLTDVLAPIKEFGVPLGMPVDAIDRIAERQLKSRIEADDCPTMWGAAEEGSTESAPVAGPLVEPEPTPAAELKAPDQLLTDIAGFEVSAKRLGIEGDNSVISIRDLVSWFSIQDRDGVLRVRIPEETVTIVFEKGALVQAWSDNSPAGSRLGEILVAQGAFDQQQLASYLKEWQSGSKRFGDRLEDGELIDREALLEGLKTQIKQLLVRLFSAEQAKFVLREGQLLETDGQLNLNVMELLLDEARARDEAHR